MRCFSGDKTCNSAFTGSYGADRQRLSELGYVDGKTILIDERYADGNVQRLSELARELAASNVEVIVASAVAATSAARQAITTIPIVMVHAGNPIGAGLIASLARPGGNVTGTTNLPLGGKHVDLLHELVPRMARLSILANPTNAFSASVVASMNVAAFKSNINVVVAEVTRAEDFPQALATIRSAHADGLAVAMEPSFTVRGAELIDFAATARLTPQVTLRGRRVMLNGLSVRRFAALASLLCVVAVSGDLQAQTKPTRTDVGGEDPNSFLWVGNSFFYYNNSMHNHVGNLARAADPKTGYRGVSVTISGSGIDWHDMESYFRPNGIGKYSFVGDNEIVFNKPGKQFDAVILMDCSQCPIHPQLKSVFHEYAKRQSETIVRNGARPILFMSWAYKDKPDMTAQLAEQYTIAGNANDALVIPAGLAFAKAIAKRPDIELYQPDKRHPSLLGTYLAASTFYAATTKKSPVGNAYTAGIEPALAGVLQATAWETVQEYYAK